MLLETIFSGATYERFVTNPAGMRMHHAYLGGLLQHSVDVTGLAVALAEQIEGVDKDLVIAGALLHDIGKIREISAEIGFPYTSEGRLLGHITMSCMMVQEQLPSCVCRPLVWSSCSTFCCRTMAITKRVLR